MLLLVNNNFLHMLPFYNARYEMQTIKTNAWSLCYTYYVQMITFSCVSSEEAVQLFCYQRSSKGVILSCMSSETTDILTVMCIVLHTQSIPLYFWQVFDKNWHKLHFGVHRDQVVLYVDCEHMATERLEPRGPIDVNGDITISKLAGSRNTVPVCITFYVQ